MWSSSSTSNTTSTFRSIKPKTTVFGVNDNTNTKSITTPSTSPKSVKIIQNSARMCVAEDLEREVWEKMAPMAWHNSIAAADSIFFETYKITRNVLRETAHQGGYDVIVEVGCGTGDVIGEMNTSQPVKIPCIGVDINKDFINFCQENHPHEQCEFHLADALKLVDWWTEQGFDKIYKKPLVICVNNTLNIMPHELRGGVVDQMLSLAGKDGLCLVTYWNGHFFSHAIMNYYKKNQPLCGRFDVHQHIDWSRRILVTPSNYMTHWQTPIEVQSLLRSYDVDVPNMESTPKYCHPHIHSDGLAIFVWFDQTSTSNAKGYYDSDDAQKFYNNIWGEDELHLGRYDLLTDEERATLSLGDQVKRAENLHEQELVKLIHKHTLQGQNHSLRIVDLGCGFGGLMRRLWQEGLVWKATGCDISSKMCEQSRLKNDAVGAGDDIEILEESYLQVSVPDQSADLVISMDALLHVGPVRQRRAMLEAARMLRPGGWIIFSDIMQGEEVNGEEMQPIYDRINLSKMGTVRNYKEALEACGFTNFTTDLHSENIPEHYGKILTILNEKGESIGLSKQYMEKARKGLQVWKDNSPGNIEWGFILAQKTIKVDLAKVGF
jgi:sarcosine/dimethylglycine N-methyltransferase